MASELLQPSVFAPIHAMFTRLGRTLAHISPARPLLLACALLFSGADAFALPLPPHLAKGPVATIEREKITLLPPRPEKDKPTSFAVQEGRTRFRKDGRKAAAEQLPIGQSVRLYYKKEMGVWVAIEIAWKTGELPKK